MNRFLAVGLLLALSCGRPHVESTSAIQGVSPMPPASANWNSVFLFFNVASTALPASYTHTTPSAALELMDLGASPATTSISTFVRSYWSQVSRGKIAFGISTPRNSLGEVFIPTIDPPLNAAGDPDAAAWEEIIKTHLDDSAEASWRAAGNLISPAGHRWIPSIVLIQNYPASASARFFGYIRSVGGTNYEIGDVTHVQYNLTFETAIPAVPSGSTRRFWSTLIHEYGHNFLEFGDLYGPNGCTGYWDLLGDNSPPGRMSEISSYIKDWAGFISYKSVVEGPFLPRQELALEPYSTSGEAIKIVPDPANNPEEYFTVEYRKSTGTEAWRPDGALTEEGLLITHINEKTLEHDKRNIIGSWKLHEAPFFDAEFADYSENGGALWSGHDRLNGVLYPRPGTFPSPGTTAFTQNTKPSSNFYGGRPSGLSITSIAVSGGKAKFKISIDNQPVIGWHIEPSDRCVAGRFTNEAALFGGGKELFCRKATSAAILVHRENEWLVKEVYNGWIGGWALGSVDWELAGNLDSDSRDEIYIRSPGYAGVLKWQSGGLTTAIVQAGSVGDWALGTDRETLADLNGDGINEVVIRSPHWIGVFTFDGANLSLFGPLQSGEVDGWQLTGDDFELRGRFTNVEHDEILIRRGDSMGILTWDFTNLRFRERWSKQGVLNGISGLSMPIKSSDLLTIGDFEGDGMTELFIQSGSQAGVGKWRNGEVKIFWIATDSIAREGSTTPISLAPSDQVYSGRFRKDKSAILHRGSAGVSVLEWDGAKVTAILAFDQPIQGKFTLKDSDRFVIGDYDRRGLDIATPARDAIGDYIDDVFILRDNGSAMLGINHATFGVSPARWDGGLTWLRSSNIMRAF